MRLKLYAAALLWLPFACVAGTNTWTAIGPAGGSLQALVFGKTTGTVFAAGVSGVYRSVDDGADWQVVKTDFPDNQPTGLAVDPSDATRVYVVAPTAPSLYVSTDGGATLQASTTLPNSVAARQIGVSHDGQTLYIVSAGQIFVSTDRGNTWSQRTAITTDPLALATGIVVDPTDRNTVYVPIQLSSTEVEEVVGTHDGGVTWQVLNSLSYAPVPAIAINPSNPAQLWMARYDGIWTSLNQGVSWTYITAPGLAAYFPSALTVDPQHPASVYVVDLSEVVWHSSDGGSTWTHAAGSPSAGQVYAIAVDPAQSSRILEAGNVGIAGSTDSGSTWSAQEGGLFASNIISMSVDSATGAVYASVSNEGIYSASPGASPFLSLNNPPLLTLACNPLYPSGPTNWVSALLAQPGKLLAGTLDGLAISLDDGGTWTLSTVAAPCGNGNQQLLQLASSTANPQTLLAAGDGSLYLSVDGGSTWSNAGNGLPANTSLSRIIVAPSSGQVAYTQGSAGSGAVLYHSNDAGMNWAPLTITSTASPTLLLAVDPNVFTTVYGATDQTLLKSTDGGNAWSVLPFPVGLMGGAPQVLVVDPVHPQILIAARASGVARSVDSGATWESVQSTSSGWGVSSLVFDPLHPETFTVGTYNFGAHQITIAPDLSLTGNAPAGSVVSGSAATFGFTVTNSGPYAATNVTVTVPMPATTQSSSATGSGATCTTSASSATCTIPVLHSGDSVDLTLNVNGLPEGSVQVVGTVSADQPDANTQNNSATLTASVAAASTSSGSTSKGGGGGMSLWELLLLGVTFGATRLGRRYDTPHEPSGDHPVRSTGGRSGYSA